MIQIKKIDSQINEYDEVKRAESGWLDIDALVLPIREGGFRGTGEITIASVRLQIESRIKIGEVEGMLPYRPRTEHDQTQQEFPFVVLWRYVEESSQSTNDSGESPPQSS